jgi:hypothetical protein
MEIAKELNVLGIIIRFLDTIPPIPDQPHAAVLIFSVFWETFEALKTCFLGSDAVLLELCTIFDSIIHSAKGRSLEVLPTVFQTLLSIMEQVISHLSFPSALCTGCHSPLINVATMQYLLILHDLQPHCLR